MAEPSTFLTKQRCAVITGGNKGIGLEVCRQLASQGVIVVLTARNQERGKQAIDNLNKSAGMINHNDLLLFHQLDVTNPTSISTLADFIKAKFGKLDILVNNAGISGVIPDFNALIAAGFGTPGAQVDFSKYMIQTYELAEECLNTNYYGVKETIENLLPLLQLSDSPRIVNVSSSAGKLKNLPNEEVRGVLCNVDDLSEEKVDKIVNKFMRDFSDGSFVANGWPSFFAAYTVSKAALNAYTRIMAMKYPSVSINCICPGPVKTDLTGNTGILSVTEGAASPVRLALMPQGSSSGLFYLRDEVTSFD